MKSLSLPRQLVSARMIPIFFIGTIIGIIDLFVELSFAALIFSGPLTGYVANGFGMLLVAAVVIAIVVALGSSFSGSVALPQDIPVAILALVVAGITTQMGKRSPEAMFATVFGAIVLSSFLTGIVFFLAGRFRWSVFARYMPYPVIGGFLAGTGFLLAQGALGVMVNVGSDWSGLLALLDPAAMWRWVPGVVFGVTMLLVLRRLTHFLILPGMVLGAIGLFYLIVFLSGHTPADAAAQGWLVSTTPLSASWQPPTPELIVQVDWMVVASQWDKILTILFISVIGMLLNVSGMELVARRDFNLDRELKTAGVANMLSAFVGGPVGYHALSLSALAARFGDKSRGIGLVTAAVIFATLVVGMSWITFVPRWVLGGLLFFLGLAFLVEWLYDAWFKLSRTDYALVVAILGVSATIGFLQGVALGIAIATVLFVIKYSRVQVVNHSLTGVTYRSTVDRSASHRALLRAHGDELVILQLQEYIFFGTAQRLLERLKARIADEMLPEVQFIVLDFRRVPGLDSSAVAVFARIKQLVQAQHIQLILTHLAPAMHEQLLRGQVLGHGDSSTIHTFATLDHGVEWCENETLRRLGHNDDEPELLEQQFSRILESPVEIEHLREHLTRLELPARTRLLQQGETADALYFIESGSVSIELELANGKRARLRTIRRGCVVGEVAMYTHGVRTASVETMEPSVVYRLTAEHLSHLEGQDPLIANAIHRWIAGQMAERLSDNVRTLEAVMQ